MEFTISNDIIKNIYFYKKTG